MNELNLKIITIREVKSLIIIYSAFLWVPIGIVLGMYVNPYLEVLGFLTAVHLLLAYCSIFTSRNVKEMKNN